jgi:hypothetical protein
MAPANQYNVNVGGVGSAEGQPNNRDKPCSRNSSATTIRTMLRTWGEKLETADGTREVVCSMGIDRCPFSPFPFNAPTDKPSGRKMPLTIF